MQPLRLRSLRVALRHLLPTLRPLVRRSIRKLIVDASLTLKRKVVPRLAFRASTEPLGFTRNVRLVIPTPLRMGLSESTIVTVWLTVLVCPVGSVTVSVTGYLPGAA